MAAYCQKEATGTSLAAIIVIGLLAVAAQAGYGNVDLWNGLSIGRPPLRAGPRALPCSSGFPSARWRPLLSWRSLLASAAVLIL